ncbi:MAG: hypothetical protein QM755_13140 [Luteolibacter sp.]
MRNHPEVTLVRWWEAGRTLSVMVRWIGFTTPVAMNLIGPRHRARPRPKRKSSMPSCLGELTTACIRADKFQSGARFTFTQDVGGGSRDRDCR